MIITVLEALKLIILLLIIIYAILAACGVARRKKYRGYNHVVYTLEHMRNRSEVSPCTKTRSQKKLCRNA